MRKKPQEPLKKSIITAHELDMTQHGEKAVFIVDRKLRRKLRRGAFTWSERMGVR